MEALLSRPLDAIYRLCIWAAGGAIACMSLIVPWGIFTRYVLGSGSAWPEPIAIMLMVVFSFLGAAAAYRAGAHIAVQMLTSQLPPALQRAAAFFCDLVMLAVCLFVVVWGTQLCIGTWGQSLDTLPWMPVGLTYAALPLGSLFTALFVLERMLRGSQARRPIVAFGEPGAEFDADKA
ncbi:MAG: TRAP transporter small permease [Betaproteobacteria bacterium]|nr:TRAP transporter small permease [Betaproteobacteria bacterium]MCC6246752.1 TRAP transporter small permease [Rubrivivax sp.]